MDSRRAAGVPSCRSGTSIVPGVVGSRVHRDATQRAARSTLDRLRRTKGDRLDQPRARLRRVRTSRAPRQDSTGASTHRPRPHHADRHQRVATLATRRATGRSASTAPGGCSPTATVNQSTRTRSPKRSRGSPGAPTFRSFDCTICGTPTGHCSSPRAFRSRSSPNGSVTPRPCSRCDIYQHVLPGMQAHAARVFEQLDRRQPSPGARNVGEDPGEAPEEDRLNSVEAANDDEGPGR